MKQKWNRQFFLEIDLQRSGKLEPYDGVAHTNFLQIYFEKKQRSLLMDFLWTSNDKNIFTKTRPVRAFIAEFLYITRFFFKKVSFFWFSYTF